MATIDVMGDSIAETWDATRWPLLLLSRLETGYPAYVGSQYSPWSGEARTNLYTGTRWTLYAAGIGGNTTGAMVARFATDVLGHSAQYLVVSGGTNDVLGGGTTNTAANLFSMCESGIAAGRRVFLCTVPPMNNTTDAMLNAIDAVNTLIRAYAADGSHGVTLVDVYAALENPSAPRSSLLLAEDGVHPSTAGYAAIAALFTSALFGVVWSQGLVGDWSVYPDGTIRDYITGGQATISSPITPVLWNTIRTGGRGYCAVIANGINVDIPTAGWSAASGSWFAVMGAASDSAFRRLVGWYADANNRLSMYQRASMNYGLGMATVKAGAVLGADAAVTSGTGAKTSCGTWVVGGKVRHYTNGANAVANTGNNYSAVANLPATARIGSQPDNTGYYLGAFCRLLVFDRALSADEVAALHAWAIDGTRPLALLNQLYMGA